MINPSRRRFFCACAAVAAPFAAQAQTSPALPSPSEAIARILEGNRLFQDDDPTRPEVSQARRDMLTRSQRPFAAILGCADSRTPPESLFHVGLGDLFTVRIAGNSPTLGTVGTLEYAVEELQVPLILVMGHERCGAVAAANHLLETGIALPGVLNELVLPILPAIIEARRSRAPDVLDAAVRIHAQRTARRLRDGSGLIAGAVREGKLRVEPAYYSLDDGVVSVLPH
ncbi:MAG: carbonic anhydrase [Roseococcus sp.]